MINDLFSKGILIGLGAAVAGKEKLEETVMKLVEKGMMSENEADSLYSDLLKKGTKKSETWNQELRTTVTNEIKELGFATKQELETLQAQIVLLQQELALLRNDRTETSNSAVSESGFVQETTSHTVTNPDTGLSRGFEADTTSKTNTNSTLNVNTDSKLD